MLEWVNNLFDQDLEELVATKSLLTSDLRRVLRELLRDCEAHYRSAGQRYVYEFPEHIDGDETKFTERLRDLHRGVLVKTLITIAHCDRRWNGAEKEVATIVLQHAWGVQVSGAALSKALQNVIEHAEMLQWKELVKPFVDVALLADEANSLRTIIMRLANLVAKADGQVLPAELVQLETMQRELDEAFQRKAAGAGRHRQTKKLEIDAGVAALVQSADDDSEPTDADSRTSCKNSPEPSAEQRKQMLEGAMKELDALIGLEPIKAEIRRLVDFIKVQSARQQHNLPATAVSLHSVFVGKPGTGKTTVARIVGNLLCGLGILKKGHTIETDRSGLVAEYAGQTGPRTNSRIDEALDGVLFLDEAYSLVAGHGEDAFGTEAIQTLMKRMEDERDRFITVLAGYPVPMDEMLRSNPGMCSRFQQTLSFPDYSADELLRIFYALSKKHHYRMPKTTQRKVHAGFQALIDCKDEHFGNGRLARNLFEKAIRHMSSRIVCITPLTRKLLTTLEPEDIVF